MARAAFAAGEADEARAWIARAQGAPAEPDWSDIDPEGRAFPYTPEDWARVAAVYAETGELAHPRLERQERTLSALPEIPLSYHASAPFLRAAEAGSGLAPLPDDPGPAVEDDEPTDAPKPGGQSGGRGLAPGTRAAK
jgi:HemY protein